ncbi:MAG: penicillin acylase family protein [Candidatus Hydrogenedentes bacterium]|nr:penicillin acylase family protein [Candidatus Hydrogenedentota bacterium]
MKYRVLSACAGLIVLGYTGLACAGEVTIYRDTWGVPHIYSDTEGGAAFGLGYCMAEDRLEDLYRNLHMVLGSAAEHFGPDHVETDYVMRLMKNREVCMQMWEESTPELRALGEGLVQGVQAYEAEHPEKRPEFAMDLEPWMCAAIGRAMIIRWPIGNLWDEVQRKRDKPEFASNSWAVAPKRSAEGCPILLTDVHMAWETLALMYEARVFGGDLAMCGWFILGSPLLGLGHTKDVGWAFTTGGTDTGDVYALKIDPKNPTRYEVDGEWRTAQLKLYTIRVKGEDKARMMPALYTDFGPLLGEPDTEKGVAYAGKTPYMEVLPIFEQMYRMCKAKNADEFYEALKMDSLMEQNITYADRDGNIGYVRAGRAPIRPEGDWDWTKPVPGNTSATEWTGIYPLEDHVQIRNPEQGYMQNCNISPANMMIDSPMTEDKYPSVLYNVSWDNNNPRGKRAVQLLSADDSITKEEAMAIVMDVYDIISKPWQDAIKAAADAAGAGEYQDAVDQILAWNGQFTKDSAVPVWMWRLRLACKGKIDVQAIADNQPLTADDQKLLMSLLGETLQEVEQTYGKRDITWGETHVVGRGDKFYGYDGADFERGAIMTETLRDVEASERKDKPGYYVADSGSLAPVLMFLHKDGIESYTLSNWGQSADPASDHYTDQAAELYSQRKLKPTWFKKEDLLQHVASEKVLQTP